LTELFAFLDYQSRGKLGRGREVVRAAAFAPDETLGRAA
jgi:hypothetical protein